LSPIEEVKTLTSRQATLVRDRKQIEAELRESEQRLRWLASIVESSDDAIVSKNLDGIITSWNRGAERTFGYSAEEAIGQPITIIIPQDRRDEERVILSGSDEESVSIISRPFGNANMAV
jgi:PAS domain S-box-containing protein